MDINVFREMVPRNLTGFWDDMVLGIKLCRAARILKKQWNTFVSLSNSIPCMLPHTARWVMRERR